MTRKSEGTGLPGRQQRASQWEGFPCAHHTMSAAACMPFLAKSSGEKETLKERTNGGQAGAGLPGCEAVSPGRIGNLPGHPVWEPDVLLRELAAALGGDVNTRETPETEQAEYRD